MRASGRLHLGHYHGVLKNWLQMQQQFECFYFVADWHGLTTHYADPAIVRESTWEMLVDWLATGLDPQRAVIFIQSRVPQHAELYLLLSMITPLAWLERVPSYKDQIAKLSDKNLATYGFLGYPLLQSADILIYRAGLVPVGADQVAHIGIVREIARRFNHLYGHDETFRETLKSLQDNLPIEQKGEVEKLRTRYLQNGDQQALLQAQNILRKTGATPDTLAVWFGYLENSGRMILPLCEAKLTQTPKVSGLDGQKMSKSYGNTIDLRDHPDTVSNKIRTMPTDPARVRRHDPGTPEKCPVWEFHQLYSDNQTCEWVHQGCTSASIGCLACKNRVAEAVIEELRPIRERAAVFASDRMQLERWVQLGIDRAQEEAEATLDAVRAVMGLS